MGSRRQSRLTRGASVFSYLSSALMCLATALGTAPAQGQEQPQPETLPEFVDAMLYSIDTMLTAEERQRIRGLSWNEVEYVAPETYKKIRINADGWTNAWIESVQDVIETVPEQRLAAARAEADSADDALRSFFESKGWPYKPLEVVFLPRRLFHDRRRPGAHIYGMVIPYYRHAFFATTALSSPMPLVLIHETIHLNKTGRRYPRALREGITESATGYVAARYDLVSAKMLRQESTYPDERRRIEVILEEMTRRTGSSRDEALEVLLEAYLTGDQTAMYEIFGQGPWERVIDLAGSSRWFKRDILKTLNHPPDAEPN